ncbi:MAG: hypothetical protein LC768_13595 [Acidobacteria bacterium]|nr:hypothetical protein [Acidobacteriota bacterium]
MSVDIARLTAVYTADTSSFERGTKRVESGLESTVGASKNAGSAVANFETKTNRLGNSLNSLGGFAQKGSNAISTFVGNLASNAVTAFASKMAELGKESFKLAGSFDRLTRFTATLDKNFQTPEALNQLKRDFESIAPITGQAAEDIARASFTMKSAFSTLDSSELKAYLTEFGMAAIQSTSSDAAGNTTNLQNAIAKLSDPKYIEGLDKVFNIERFTKDGGIKSLNEIINELAKNLDGLSDQKKLEKITSVFKDQQAVQGIMGLVNGVKLYNEQLAKGGDLSAQAAKQDIMLNGMEARWAAFYSNIENQQRAFGEKFGAIFLSIGEQQTNTGGISAFFVNLGAEISLGAAELGRVALSALAGVGGVIAGLIADLFNLDTSGMNARIASALSAIDTGFNEIEVGIENRRTSKMGEIQARQKKYFEDIIVSPIADPALKESARKSLEGINKTIEEGVGKIGTGNNKVGENVAKSITSSTPKAEAASSQLAKSVADKYIDSLSGKGQMMFQAQTLMVKPNTGAASASGDRLGKALGDGAYKSVLAKQADIEQAERNAMQPRSIGIFTVLGGSVGAAFGQGMFNGVSSWAGRLADKVSSMVSGMFGAASKAQDSHSPSKRAIEEIGKPFGQGIALGIDETQATVGNAAQSLVDNAFKKAKPKKERFKVLAKEIVQEFQDSIESLASVADAPMMPNLRVPDSKKFRVTDKDGVELLTSLVNELSRFNLSSKEAEVKLQLVTSAFAKLNPEIKASILLTAQQIDGNEKLKENMDGLASVMDELGSSFRVETKLQEVNKIFADPAKAQAIERYAAAIGLTVTQMQALARLKAGIFDEKENPLQVPDAFRGTAQGVGNLGIGPAPIAPVVQPPPSAPWDSFFGNIKLRMAELGASIPGIKSQLTDVFISLPESIGNVFANSVANWDGTFKGFFKSIAAGFADMLKQMAAELIRFAIIKAITSAIGGAFGGIKVGGGLKLQDASSMNFRPLIPLPGKAGGGVVEANKPFIVGEYEPEVFVPRQNGRIYNQKQLGELNQKTAQNVTVYVTNNFQPHPQTGAFSRESAEQAAKRISHFQQKTFGG